MDPDDFILWDFTGKRNTIFNIDLTAPETILLQVIECTARDYVEGIAFTSDKYYKIEISARSKPYSNDDSIDPDDLLLDLAKLLSLGYNGTATICCPAYTSARQYIFENISGIPHIIVSNADILPTDIIDIIDLDDPIYIHLQPTT
jgi:hypothetical protein